MTSRNFKEKLTLSPFVTFRHATLDSIKYDDTNVYPHSL